MLYFGDYKGADEALREAQRVLAACIGLPRGDDGAVRVHRLAVQCLAQIAEKSCQQGRYKEADVMYTRTLTELASSDMDRDCGVLVADVKEGHARVLDKLGLARRGLELVTDALEIRKAVPGYDAAGLFRGYELLAQLHIALGGLREAQAAHDTAAEMLGRAASASAWDASEKMLVAAELSVMRAAELGAAEQQVRDAMRVREAHVGREHPVLAQMQLQRCRVLVELRRFGEADALVKGAMATLTVHFGKLSPHLAAAMRVQAVVLASRGEYDRARLAVTEALAIDSSEDLAAAMPSKDLRRRERRGSEVVASGPPDEATRQARMSGGGGSGMTPQVAEDLEALGRLHLKTGALDAAEETLIRMYEMCLDMFRPDQPDRRRAAVRHPMIGRALRLLAQVCLARACSRTGEAV
jgi:tetratricopeptide (TPR) repeat protein